MTTLNEAQAQALVSLFDAEIPDEGTVELDNEYMIGSGKLLKVRHDKDGRVTTADGYWLIGADGGVIKL